MSEVTWLQHWFVSQADGSWEHSYGVKIDTLDNPGWKVVIDLVGTKFEKMPDREISKAESETDWIRCRISSGKFEGYGDALKLGTLITTFREWVE